MKQNKKIYLRSLLDIRPRKTVDLMTDSFYAHIELPLWEKFEKLLEYNVGSKVDAQAERDLKALENHK